MAPGQFHRIETVTFFLITIWGVSQREVTVFYVIYLFWFREFVRSLIDLLHAFKNRNSHKLSLKEGYGNFMILFVYLVFIVLLFGLMLNWNNRELLFSNMEILMFRNLYFDMNVLLFAIQYLIYRKGRGAGGIDLAIFNKNHLILHISIILGALIQLGLVKKYPEYFSGKELWGSALVVLPFLILKIWIGRKEFAMENQK